MMDMNFRLIMIPLLLNLIIYNKITLGEYEEMTKPLDREIEQEPVLDKIRAEIEQNAYPIVHGVNNHEKGMTLYGVLQIIDKGRCKYPV